MPAGRLPTDRPTDGGTEDGRRDGTERKGTNEPNDGGNERTKHPTGMNKRINESIDGQQRTDQIRHRSSHRSFVGGPGGGAVPLLVGFFDGTQTNEREIHRSVSYIAVRVRGMFRRMCVCVSLPC